MKMKSDEREKVIIEFVRDHDDCSPKDAFEGVSQKMSRQTFFNCLGELKNCKILREENRNKRDKSLHVNDGLIVEIMIELDCCESAYFDFLKKVLIEIRKPISMEKDRKGIIRPFVLLFDALEHFRVLMNYYNYNLAIVWPLLISNIKYLEKLQSYTLHGISKMYAVLYKTLKTEKIDRYVESIPLIAGNFDEIIAGTMKGALDVYSEVEKNNLFDRYKPYGLEKYARNLFSLKAFSNS